MVKVGSFKSPFVGRENADAILAFEESEFYRNLIFLKKGGLAIVNSARTDLPSQIGALVEARRISCYLVDADAIARSIGSAQASNMAMLGFFSLFMLGPYSFENIVGAIGRKVAPRLFEMNRSVSEAGYGEAAQRLAKSKVQA
jgi:indolepyruvate ferredoxin oxidoreductase beta subunit